MIKSRYFNDKEFASKEELFKDLRENVDLIIAEKTASIQKSCEKGIAVKHIPLDVTKFDEEQAKALNLNPNKYYIAVNTTKILDSHDDVHINGIWNKTVSDQQFKNYLVADHCISVMTTIVRKEHIEMFVAKIPFSALGYDYKGNTEALIYAFDKDKVMIDAVKNWLDSGDAIEASVRMQYVNIEFCMDSNDPVDAKAKANYDKYINDIANKDDYEYISHFFAIREAKNVRESSLVPFGSNYVTGQLKNTEPTPVTQNKEEEIESVQPIKSVWDEFIPKESKSNFWDVYLN